MTEPVGLARGLTNYGDPDFALYLRRSFARSMGYLDRFAGRRRSSALPTHLPASTIATGTSPS